MCKILLKRSNLIKCLAKIPRQNTSPHRIPYHKEYLATQNTLPHRIPHHTDYLTTQNTSPAKYLAKIPRHILYSSFIPSRTRCSISCAALLLLLLCIIVERVTHQPNAYVISKVDYFVRTCWSTYSVRTKDNV